MDNPPRNHSVTTIFGYSPNTRTISLRHNRGTHLSVSHSPNRGEFLFTPTKTLRISNDEVCYINKSLSVINYLLWQLRKGPQEPKSGKSYKKNSQLTSPCSSLKTYLNQFFVFKACHVGSFYLKTYMD